MESTGKKYKANKKIDGINIFTVPFHLEEIKESLIINSPEYSKEKVINQAINFQSKGKIREAKKYYQYCLKNGFNDFRVFSNYGTILRDLGNLKEAELLHRKAIKLKPDSSIVHCKLGITLRDIGQLKEAELSLRKAVELDPDYAMAHFNLGTVYIAQKKLKEAELSTRRSIELKSDFADSHHNLGIVLKDIGELKDAEISLFKAIKINPDEANIHYNLGVVLLQQGKNELSLKYFSKSTELLRGKKIKEPNHKRFKVISKAKIEHDIEQFEYLLSHGYEPKKFSDLSIIYKNFLNKINWQSETTIIYLSDKYQTLLNNNYNSLIHLIDTPKLKEGAVNTSLDIEEITNDYFNHDLELTYIDNFLTTKAVEELRKFFLGSTIWFDVKDGGYLGAYLKEGLANPLIIQIAEELRKKFPKIFKDHLISQIWAFKYDSRSKNEGTSIKGINIHADQAAVNVNFWITPKEANLNSDSGGLVVYDVEAPKDWDFMTFNTDENRILEAIKKNNGNAKVIPYNENRAVLFNSNLFHETDTYEFKEGYENRRINVTMLFGKRNY